MKRKRVLVVNDEPETGILLGRLLEAGGFRPVMARSSKEALAKARQKLPEMIVLDVMMAGDEGARIYRSIKSDAELKTVPVIMVSNIARKTLIPCLRAQCAMAEAPFQDPEAFLEKPIEGEELLRLGYILTGGPPPSDNTNAT